MPTQPPQTALSILKLRFDGGVRVTPLCRAVIGWLCDVRTVPSVADLCLRDGQVLLRLSDEPALEPLCPFLEFLDQVRVICTSLHMTEAQARDVVAWAGHRLGEQGGSG